MNTSGLWIITVLVTLGGLIAENDRKTDAFLKADRYAWIKAVVGGFFGVLILLNNPMTASLDDLMEGGMAVFSSVLFVVGLLSVLPSGLKERITAQDNIGWLIVLIGATVMVLFSIVPIWSILQPHLSDIWSELNIWHLGAFVLSLALIILGARYVRHKKNS